MATSFDALVRLKLAVPRCLPIEYSRILYTVNYGIHT